MGSTEPTCPNDAPAKQCIFLICKIDIGTIITGCCKKVDTIFQNSKNWPKEGAECFVIRFLTIGEVQPISISYCELKEILEYMCILIKI